MTVDLEGLRRLPELPSNQCYFIIGPGGKQADVDRVRPILAKIGVSLVIVHLTF